MQDDFENLQPQEDPENPRASEPLNIPDDSIPEEAVVRMSSDRGSSAGDTGTPADSPPEPQESPPPHYPLDTPYTDTSPFWQNPLEERTYIDAPYGALGIRSLMLQVEQACEYLRSAGFEAERHELLHQFYTKVLTPIREYEMLRHELEPQRRDLQQRIEATREALEQTEEQFIEKLAQARLPLPQPHARKAHKGQMHADSSLVVTPQLVEEALQYAFADRQEICGEQGIVPPQDYKSSFWAQLALVGTFLLELLAPLTAGFLLGINIGVVTGLLKLDDLIHLRNMQVLALAAGVGFVVEKLGGIVYYHLFSSYAQLLERRDALREDRPVPALKGWIPLLFLTVLALALGASMVTVDALGIRMLHEEAIRKMILEGIGQGKETFPLIVYLIVGLIVSTPYLIYKAVRGWRDSEIRQREAYLDYLIRQHIEERRNEPAVQEAFVLGERAVKLREQLGFLHQRLEAVKARLDSARTQAIGMHHQFQDYFANLMAQIRALQAQAIRGGSIPFNRRAMQDETFLTRLARWLQRG